MVEWKKDLIDQDDSPWISFEGGEEIAVIMEMAGGADGEDRV